MDPGDPHSLGVLDGPVQGAEKRAALLHHAVEVGLVKEVTLGITEVLGAKPGRGTGGQRRPWGTGHHDGGCGPHCSFALPGSPSPSKVHLPGLGQLLLNQRLHSLAQEG